MPQNKNSSQWVSLSDMMTGLMLVFLLISILVMSEIQEEEKEKNRVLVEYSNVKNEIYKDLKKAFEEKEQDWDMTIDDDLTIKFSNPEVLFEANSARIRTGFSSILNDFVPQYLKIIDSDKYNGKIKEVRVEGHAGRCLESEYWICLNLSQGRANSVVQNIFNNSTFLNFNDKQKQKMKFLFTSNGMSNGKNLDSSGEYIYYSSNDLDPEVSRRVEFRIVTNSEELVDELINKIK